MVTKRIGFIDDNLDNFHANTYLKAICGQLAERGWSVAGVTALREGEGRKWRAQNGVSYFNTPDELSAAMDVFAILAPSTPQTPPGLCEAVLPRGKTTFVDKPFASDTATAKRIFALADRQGVAVQSTSALRTTNVSAEVRALSEPLVPRVETLAVMRILDAARNPASRVGWATV